MNEEQYKTFEELKEELGTDYDIKLYEIGKSAVKEIERLNKEKDYLDDYNRHLHNENKRLNNIINELEKWLEYQGDHTTQQHNYYSVLDKLKKLKEGKE